MTSWAINATLPGGLNFDTSTGVTLYNGGEDVTDLVKTKLGM